MSSYKFNDKVYQFMLNARAGEVQRIMTRETRQKYLILLLSLKIKYNIYIQRITSLTYSNYSQVKAPSLMKISLKTLIQLK